MSDSPLIAQPGKQKMTLLRESYHAICDGDSCAARLLNAMERWHTWKLQVREELRGRNRIRQQGGLDPNNDEDLWVRMAIDPKDGKSLGWKSELMDEYSYKVVARALDLLVSKGFALKRENPRQNWDRTPQWLFQVTAVQTAVDTWGAGRTDPGMSKDVDGTPETTEQEKAVPEHSAHSTDSTRQKDRVDSAEEPSRVGKKTESTRQKDRSNSTDIPPQVPCTALPEQAVAPTPLEGNARATPFPHAAAAISPDGSNRALPEALPFPVTGVQLEGANLNTGATHTENVPGGAAGEYAILALTPVPRAQLQARPARDPEHMPQLRALLNASHRTRLDHLNALLSGATQTGGLPRELLTRLTDDELGQVARAAKLDAHHPGGFAKFGALGLDRMIGAPITQAVIEGRRPSTDAPLGRAYDVKNEPTQVAVAPPPAPLQDDLSRYKGIWELKKNPDKAIDIIDIELRPGKTALLHVGDGDTLTVARLMLDYQRPHWMQHSVSA